MGWIELFVGMVALFAAVSGAYAKHVENSLKERMKAQDDNLTERIDTNEKNDGQTKEKLEDLEEKVRDHWENDAKQYVLKRDFMSFARDIKDSLIRIEEKIESLRSHD